MAFFSSKKTSNSTPSDYSEYVDPSGDFTTGQFKISLWYVRHKNALRQGLKIFLIGISIGLWGFSLWQWGNYALFLVTKSNNFEQSLVAFPDYSTTSVQFAPESIKILNTDVFQSGVGKYDVVADVVNPNDRFMVEFDYYFFIEDVSTPRQRAFLLPGEHRPVASLGLTSENSSFGLPTIRIENVRWQRIDPKTYPNPSGFQSARLMFETSSTTFIRAENTPGAVAHVLTFDLTNVSAYGYRTPAFYIGLYNGQNLSGLFFRQTEDFRSQETKHLDIRSFAPNLSVTEVKIFPLINVYDKTVYLKP